MDNVFRKVDAVIHSIEEMLVKQSFGSRPQTRTSIRITLGKDQLMALYEGKVAVYRTGDTEIRIEGDPCRT